MRKSGQVERNEMSIKIEVTITVWEDGLFKSRDIISSDDTDVMMKQFEVAMDIIDKRLAQADAKKYAIGEDDGIPF